DDDAVLTPPAKAQFLYERTPCGDRKRASFAPFRGRASMSRAAFVSLCLAAACGAQNCPATSPGRIPLNDLGPGFYQGFQGGLYPGGQNARPPAHEAAGLA